MSVKVVGHVAPKQPLVYVLESGKSITFHTALWGDKKTTFFVPLNSWPSLIADKLGVRYSFMRNATNQEAADLILIKKLNVKDVVEV